MYLLRRHAVGLAQRGAQQGLEVQVEAHGGLTVEISRTADARHLHQQVLETRPSVEVASRPAERERENSVGATSRSTDPWTSFRDAVTCKSPAAGPGLWLN